MRKILAAAALLLLAACGPSEEERVSAFMTKCVRTEFSYAQCEVLLSIKEEAHGARTSANIATMVSGASAGMNAGRK